MKKILLSIFVSVLLLVISSTYTYSRAGGGDSFGDGGYDSGGSSWSSSSDSYDFGSTGNTSSSGSPCVGLVILAIIVVIIIISKRRQGNNPGGGSISTPSQGNATNKSMSPEEITTELTKLKEIDPQFDEQKFKTHVKKVFMAVQEGWTNRDQKICRPFMAEEVFQSHEMQVQSMIKNKEINVLENIVVGSSDFARIDLGTDYHKITMKIRASMRDYRIREDDPKKVIGGSKDQVPPFTEYWAFIRKSNLKSKVKDGIFDRKCPNCGAPIDVDVAGVCKYCNANVVNGDYDWVLSEIIQKSEWQE